MPKEKKAKKTKKSQKEQFLKKSLLDSKDIKQVSQTKFNNLRINISSIKKITPKQTSQIYNTYPYQHISYSIIKLGLQISKNKFSSHSEICQKILETIRDIIIETSGEDKIFTRYIEKKIIILQKILEEFIRLDETMMNLFEYFYELLKIIPLKAQFDKAKIWFVDKIDDYIERRIVTAADMLSEHGAKIIKNGDNILILSLTDTIKNTLLKSLENGINFNIYLVLEKENQNQKKMAFFLQKKGINVICTNNANLSYFMNKVNKVFTDGFCIYSNGYLTAKSGIGISAIFAKKFRKPFYVFIRTFKFSEKTQIDSFMANESFVDEEGKVFLEKDLVPDRLLSLLVTEIGLMPPTTVPVILREFGFDFEKTSF